MAGTTTPCGFPYPTGTDRVADGDNAMQALAESVDDYLVGDNAAVTLDMNVVSIVNGSRVYRSGRMATLCMEFQIQVLWNGSTYPLLTVPVGYRPVRVIRVTMATGTGTPYAMYLGTDGTLRTLMTNIAAGTQLLGHATYPLPAA